MIKFRPFLLLTLSLLLLAFVLPANAEVESTILETIQLKNKPVDVEVALSSQDVYVLDNRGLVSIYDRSGKLKDTLEVGKKYTQIRLSPREDFLFLSSEKDKTVEIRTITFVQKIDTTGSPFKGPANAPVEIVVFSDFQCPYCARIGSVLDQVLEAYPKDAKMAFKFYPLPSHKFAFKAAQAAVAAQEQGKFWEYHDLIFQNYRNLSDEKLEEFRETLKLNPEKFKKAMEAPATSTRINADKNEGTRAGVRGTPTVFVNGRMIRPARLENIKDAVAKALKERKK